MIAGWLDIGVDLDPVKDSIGIFFSKCSSQSRAVSSSGHSTYEHT
jgi:hypothetical protein